MLAGEAGCSCRVSVSSNSIRSFIKPALHVGEQIGGGAGWRATLGSAGMAAGSTTAGVKGGELCAQALTSIGSSTSIRARAGKLGVSFIGGFLHLVGATFFLGSSGIDGRPGAALHGGHALGVVGPGLGMGGLLGGQPP